ncbi:crossover junction endodeoxyribonuclease RuvC [Pusillimonas sp. CC-YST705]|uniref:Crossover junction endodeoxyribonuclease RuvC n=1 Tax=Mesopusillimonas faecipullorum TaxID=2755040 RepID=A0ABS8C856_9BURK|nr:crossover junction endodeoxyribonuclease RuvC [Mesopusillimonas faecipullorum]MCB5362208.1 crossover junction endodeoxyribonuclease RuvC [Mesopusillimonas faecipullorum]
MRILGIDPGLRRTGFGVIDAQGAALRYVASGTIVVPSDLPLAQRLLTIHEHILEVIQAHTPTVAAIEKVFVNVNASSTLLLGQARGAALCALAGGKMPVHEYTALQIKKSVVGSGHADKQQVQIMVRHLLTLNGLPAADSADALACAICHAHVGPLAERLGAGQTAATGMQLRGGRFIRK